jgi:hypothetical protein
MCNHRAFFIKLIASFGLFTDCNEKRTFQLIKSNCLNIHHNREKNRLFVIDVYDNEGRKNNEK